MRAGCMGRTVEVTERKKNVLVALFWLKLLYNVYSFNIIKKIMSLPFFGALADVLGSTRLAKLDYYV